MRRTSQQKNLFMSILICFLIIVHYSLKINNNNNSNNKKKKNFEGLIRKKESWKGQTNHSRDNHNDSLQQINGFEPKFKSNSFTSYPKLKLVNSIYNDGVVL